MSDQTAYSEWLKQDLKALTDALDLSELQHHFLHSRWLDQLLWTQNSADRSRNRYYALRLTTIIGGVIVPTLINLNIGHTTASTAVRILATGLSLIVAISAAVEQFFHYGERWRHYRRHSEQLKTEGWCFFQLSGPYRRHETHTQAYPAFAARVEAIIQREVDTYVTEITREKDKEPSKLEGK